MTRPVIKLVHSNEPSSAVKSGREEWGFENARQLGLFDDLEKTSFILIAVGEFSAHSFASLLSKYNPEAVIDTRAFPDFFRIFESTSVALASFERMGIDYLRAPINIHDSGNDLWKQLAQFQLLVDQRSTKLKPNSPIMVLVSTKSKLDELRSRLEGFVENNIPNASLFEA